MASPPGMEWWHGFHSPELNELIARAMTHNFDIAAAIARVRQADGAVRVAGAALLPNIAGTGAASWQQASLSSRTGTRAGTTTTANFHSYSVGLNAAYELDFWGKNRAVQQSAIASAMFSRFDRDTVALTTVAGVADSWFTALAFADRIALARRNLADAEQTLAVVRGRLAAGTVSALDVAQQEALVATERTVIPSLQSQMEQALIGLGILTGQPPEAITVRPTTLTSLSLPPVAPGLPSQLLARRPDIAAAEAQLEAANFNVKAARAAFYPAIQLTSSAGFQNTALSTLFGPGGFLASLAGDLSQPIFDAGALRGQLEEAHGRTDELVADYRKAVVQAFTDVDNALTAWRYATEQEKLSQQAVATSRRAAEIARAQMQAGTADITAVLQAETTLFNNEDALAQIRLARFQALLALYKALGGGWAEPSGPINEQFPGLKPGRIPGGFALPVGGNTQ